MNEKQIKIKMAEESIGSLASPLQNRGLDALEQESSQIGSLAAPVTAPEGVNPDDPFELFRASIDTGLANTQANTQNFRAAVASLLGNDEDAENLLDNAKLVQQAGAQYLVNTERFEEFLDQPTLGGFINQAIMATGQFVPSAVASVGTALVGAGVGAAVTAVSGGTAPAALLAGAAAGGLSTIPKSVAARGIIKKEVQRIVDKKVKIEAKKAQNRKTTLAMTADEEDVLTEVYAHLKKGVYEKNIKRGGVAGAFGQEFTQGTGISFGTYAEQGMTGADSAFKAGLQGLGFGAIGVGSEIAVFKAIEKVIGKAPGTGKSILKDTGFVMATSGVSEGLAETAQEELSVQQKFRIDDSYTQANANLDRTQALFMGLVGGMGVGGGTGSVAAVIGKSRTLLQESAEKAAYQNFLTNKYTAEEAGAVFTEPSAWIEAQFKAMDNKRTNKDSVWVDYNSRKEFDKVAGKIKAKYPNMQQVTIKGVGTFFTNNSDKAESFSNAMSANPYDTEMLNNFLADKLGYTRSRRPGDDIVVEVADRKGNLIWYQQGNLNEEAEIVAAAEAVAGKSAMYKVLPTKDMDQHLNNRSSLVTPVRTEKEQSASMEEEVDLGIQEQEVGNIFDVAEPELVASGPGSEATPIVPTRKQQSETRPGETIARLGWAPASTEATLPDSDLVEEARALTDPLHLAEFEKNVSQDKYSKTLLQAYVKENLNNKDVGTTFRIDAIEGRGQQLFNMKKLKMPMSEINMQDELAKSVAASKRRKSARTSRWQIKGPGMEKPVTVDMPFLTNQGMVLSKRAGLASSVAEGRNMAAADGFSYIFSELAIEGYELTYDYKPVTDAVLSDPDAIVYTSDNKQNRYSFADLQQNRPDVQNEGFEKDKKGNTIPSDERDAKIAFDPAEIQQEVEVGETEGAREPSADEKLEDQWNRRDPVSYLQGINSKGFKTSGPKVKPGLEFSTEVEKDLDASVIKTFTKVAIQKLGLKRQFKVFNTREEVNTGDPKLDAKIKAAQDFVRENDSEKARNLKGAEFDVIVLDTKADLSLAGKGFYMHALGHEIGHSFVWQEMEKSLKNSKLRGALEAAFQKERETNETMQYNNPDIDGFAEWMSDQVSRFLVDESLKAQNQTDSFFKRMAKAITTFYKEYADIVKRRFTADPAFNDYVVELSKINKREKANYEIKARVEETLEEVFGKESSFYKASQRPAERLQKTTNKLIQEGKLPKGVANIFYTADGLVRTFGEAGVKIGQFFYSQSSSTDATGLLTAKNSIGLSKMSQIQKILGLKKAADLTAEKMDILYEAENEQINTQDLKTPEAKELREWLSKHYDELGLSSLGIDKVSNFFPRVIAITELLNSDGIKKAKLVELLVERNKGGEFEVSEQEANEIVESIMKDPALASVDNSTEEDSSFNLGLLKKRADSFKALTTKELREEGLIEQPEVALQRYIDNSVKRSEFEKRGGAAELQKLVDQVKEEYGPKQAEYVEDAIKAMLGKVNPIQSDLFRKTNQVGLMFNVVTLLTFSTFASFPDLAGPILRSKELRSFRAAYNTLLAFNPLGGADAKAHREYLRQLAKDIGVIGIDAMTTTFVNAGEMDYASEGTKKGTNQFFRAIGLEQFTQFTRIFAAGMGKNFLLHHAEQTNNQQSARYLKELDITAAEVKAWAGGDINEAGNERVKLALARFVDESIVRPNSAERPVWASDPRFALVWQLKSFFYAYGKNIIGGSMRETRNRYDEAGLTGAAVPLFLGAATLLPLTMLGFDLRERTKVGLAWALPGISPQDKDYRRSQSMDWGEYSTEIFDRSGVLGPFTLALPLFMAEKRYGDPMWVGPLGPTIEKGYDFFTGDLNLKDLTPIYSSL